MSTNHTRPKPIVLAIIDGWGDSPASPGNAITSAKLPFINSLSAKYPHTLLQASGDAVGLPRGEDGNTETGHLNLGAGQIVYQDLPRINQSIADGTFFSNEQFLAGIEHAKKNRSTIHLLGLIGAGGVHSSLEHLFALINVCLTHDYPRFSIHAITDGRDSPPTSGINYIFQVKSHLNKIGAGTIASVIGRYYAMDRDHNWDRTEIAYKALTQGVGEHITKIETAIQQSYQNNISDEFITPLIVCDNSGNPLSLIKDNDVVIFFNFRIDRPRQLTKAFVLPDLNHVNISSEDFDPYAIEYQPSHLHVASKPKKIFDRPNKLNNLYFITMTEYERALPTNIAFPPEIIDMPLGRVVSDMGLRQLRIAETEKERFVTFYFNGQREDPFPGEDRIIIPSPPVPTYDQKPEMSSRELTQILTDRINANIYDLIIVNFANPDMVAHTGNLKAAIASCEITDQNLQKLHDAVLSQGGMLLITADHGNVEEMLDLKTGKVDTKHSINPVPLYLCADRWSGNHIHLQSGILADVAPTILKLMDLPTPTSMTGRSLLGSLS